jgi:hypothetical protein
MGTCGRRRSSSARASAFARDARLGETRRSLWRGRLALAITVVTLAPAAGQTPWKMPRTPDGKPDLQGTWTNVTITPIERRSDFPNLALTEAEAAGLEKAVADRIERLAQPSDPGREAPPKGGDGSTGAAGNVGGYNNFWIDSGTQIAIVNGERRSSLIVDPPDGKVPALTPEARQRTAERMAALRKRGGEYDHPEFRPLAERCLLSFGSSAGPPMLPNYFYNNNYQIVQTPDHVMILVEMVHDARIISLNAKTHLPKHIRPWMGDSIGRWEGDTLVVETTNFPSQQVFRGASENLKVIERFTRTDADTILYKFTIHDPTTFTRPFSGEVPFEATDEVIYEYACHEGNYALANILSGERNREKARAGTREQKEK